jgi:hypothetical protein
VSDSEIQAYQHICDVAVGQGVAIKLADGHWHSATITWVGDQAVYARTEDGQRHKVGRFTSTLRTLSAAA